jgi:hypothetical protein
VTKAPFTAVKSSIRNVKKYEHDVEDKGTGGLLGALRFKRKVAEANKVTKVRQTLLGPNLSQSDCRSPNGQSISYC